MQVILLICAALFSSGCTPKNEGHTLWIYTSIYNHVVHEFGERLAKRYPDLKIKWYQSGSENVAAKVNTELLGGSTRADLILTSDLFWYEDLKEKHLLLPYSSPVASKVRPEFKDADHTWTVVRLPVMVIAYNTEIYKSADAPKSFADLLLPKFKDKIAMPSPLESGTAFTTVAMLSKKMGWDYFSKLRDNGAIATGGNSAVIARLESKERPVGIVLLENVLATARKDGGKVAAVYPAEGAIPIPSPVAILASTAQPEWAKRVYDYFLSTEGQEIILTGDHHSIFTDVAAPAGARSLASILAEAFPWNAAIIHQIHSDRDEIKEQFAKRMLD